MRTGLLVLHASLAAFALVSAAAAAPVETPLHDTLTKTYQTNPDLAVERARVREVDEEVSKANALWRPSLAIEGAVEQEFTKTKDDHGKFNARSQTWSADLVASQPLFTGGRNGAEKRLALARVKSARAALRGKEQKILLDAVIAHVDAARNEIVLDLVRGDVALLQKLQQEASARLEKKLATDSDLAQIQAAIDASRAECLSVLAALQDTWRAYEQIVGEMPPVIGPASENVSVNPCIDVRGERLHSTLVLPVDLVVVPGSVAEVEKMAQGEVPELDEARAEEEAAAQRVRAAYAELMPSATLRASVGKSGENFDPQSRDTEGTVSAEVVVPIFDTGAEWSEIRAARQSNSRARLEISSAQRRVMRDALHAWYDLVSIRAVRAVNKAQAKSLLEAFEGLRGEMSNAKLHRSITDLLALRFAHLGAKKVLVGSQRDEAVAIYKLMAATGNLNATFLALPVDVYDPEKNLKSQRGKWIGGGTGED